MFYLITYEHTFVNKEGRRRILRKDIKEIIMENINKDIKEDIKEDIKIRISIILHDGHHFQ